MGDSRVIHIEQDGQLQMQIENAGKKLVVVDFTATWCGPCRMIAPVFMQLSLKYSDTVFLKVDVDECQMAAAAHQIRAMPTFIFFVDGKRVDDVRGADAQKLESTIMKWREEVNKQRNRSSSEDTNFIVDLNKVTAGRSLPCFNDLRTNEDAIFLDASSLLLRFADNVLKHPTNPKYRAVRLGNDIFQARLLPVPGAVECLFQMGFEEMDDKLILPQGCSMDMLEIMRHTIIDERNKRKLQTHVDKKVSTTQSSNAASCSDDGKSNICQALPSCCVEPVLKAGYRSFQWKPRCSTDQQVVFFERLKSSRTHVFLYENERLQEMARQRMQFDKLKAQAKENSLKSKTSENGVEDGVDERDCLLLLLLDWFKNRFFSWMNQPTCTNCNVNTKGVGAGAPTEEERKWGAGTVELYRCPNCSRSYRFPRYNHPQKLLDTRTGRCGEWANCFTLCAIAAGFEARHVLDWTDHVWTEVYSEHQQRWLHCDPCENVCDKPLLYEAGWGKKLTYLIAFSKEEVVDVSWRYSARHKDMRSRRKEVPEEWLNNVCYNMTKELQVDLPEGRRKVLLHRSVVEHVTFLVEKRTTSNEEKVGRISGSLAWRQIRGETGPCESAKSEGHVFIATEDELQQGRMRIRYCPAADKYYRGHPDDVSSCPEVMNGWESGVFSYESVFRKVEHDWNMVYLAREEGTSSGVINWSFHINNPNYKMKSLEIIAHSKTFQSGDVKWTLKRKSAKTYTIKPRDNGTYLSTPIVRGSSKLTLSAQLSGGDGDVAWQHAQLFRQNVDDSHSFPLDIVIHFQKCS